MTDSIFPAVPLEIVRRINKISSYSFLSISFTISIILQTPERLGLLSWIVYLCFISSLMFPKFS